MKVDNNRKIIVFGTGEYSELTCLLKAKVAYYVDNNSEKWGSSHLGALIHSPEKLLAEKKEELIIVIASVYYREIAEQLNGLGFKKHVHFFTLEEAIEMAGSYYPSTFNEYRNIHMNQRVFIIGNGPSLTVEDLSMIKNEYSFGSNQVYLSFNNTEWRPTYYSIIDNKVANNCKFALEELEIPKFFSHRTFMHLKNIEKVCWIYDWYYWEDNGEQSFRFSDDPYKLTYDGGSVTLFNMQLAYYMGFKEIILLGIDFNYPNVPLYSNLNRVYSDKSEHHQAYFHPEYHKEGEVYNVPNLDFMYDSYRKANDFLLDKGITVVNASRNTKLDIFPKVKLEDLL